MAAIDSDGLRVELSARFDFPVRFARRALARENPALLDAVRRREPFDRHRVFPVVDAGLAEARPGFPAELEGYLDAHRSGLIKTGPPLILPRGARPEIAAWLRSRLAAAALDPRSQLLVAGGAASLELAGYAAATFRRGLRVTRLPSSPLAQAGPGLRVVNGLDAFGRKDMLGTFHPPFAILVDFELLSSATPRGRRAGLAEALKAGLAKDAALFHWIAERGERLVAGDDDALENALRWSARLHLEESMGGGLFDPAASSALELGHWSARRLEVLSRGELSHGEAVAVGLALDLLLSRRLCGLPAAAAESALCALRSLGLRIWDEALEYRDGARLLLLDGLAESRERRGGALSIPLLRGIGEPVEVGEVPEALIAEAVKALRARGRH